MVRTLRFAIGFIIVRDHDQFGFRLKMHLSKQLFQLDNDFPVLLSNNETAAQIECFYWNLRESGRGIQDLLPGFHCRTAGAFAGNECRAGCMHTNVPRAKVGIVVH